MPERISAKDKLTIAVEGILEKRPGLKELNTQRGVVEQLQETVKWNPEEGIFPNKNLLKDELEDETQRLYGPEAKTLVTQHLQSSWAIETGAHAHIPRSFDRVARRNGPQMNSLVFQGQVLWVLANKLAGSRINLSLNTGRVPPDNINSGAYIDLPSGNTAIKTVSTKQYGETPQVLIPSIGQDDIARKMEQLNTLYGQKQISDTDYLLAREILTNFSTHPEGFTDQVVTSHALVMNRVAEMARIQQVTLDSERVAIRFIGEVLKDPDSLLSKITSDSYLYEKFVWKFSGIDTGWQENESPFYGIASKNGASHLETNYRGGVEPDELVAALNSHQALPKGVFKFFAFITEAGICPVGGMNQSAYCTEIRSRSSELLTELGEVERAKVISQMPTDTVVVSPCWGINSKTADPNLIDPITAAVKPLSEEEISKITNLSCADSLAIAAPTLYQFLVDSNTPVGYNDLLTLKADVTVVR